MSLSAFGDKAAVPSDDIVASALGDRKALWDRITGHVGLSYKGASAEWKFYSKEAGWTLVLKNGKRTLLYLIPLEGSFKANFVLGERGVAAAQGACLPPHVLSAMNEARPYMEGRSFMFDVGGEPDVGAVVKLIAVKDGG